MSWIRTTRRIRTTLALAAGAALLAACSGGTGAKGETDSAPPAAESGASDDGGGESSGTEGGNDDDGGASDGGGTGEDTDQDDGADEDGEDSAGATPRIQFTPNPAGPTTDVLSESELSGELSASLGAEATCAGPLELTGGASQSCEGPASTESEEIVPWTAVGVQIMSPEGYESGTVPGLMFVQSEEPPSEDVMRVLGSNVSGLGMGSAFGQEEISADDLGESTLQVLTSDNAYVRWHEVAAWESVTCSDAMDFTEFEPVECEARDADGGVWSLSVLPGDFVDNDRGLLVGNNGPREEPATEG
ncbi:hypothetical protein V1260_13740 [Brachybacterium sp. J144]|uniref:hypothetical protein n=1 Tax=Brachybacterium sp. J144 TaxID=3116487 RepID=UPI002E76B8F2|nr:hypothetical protein [Brachybacterium sp. J144]MEE1651840.1 hypothetical protein [Brachybacterium sp. J144]